MAPPDDPPEPVPNVAFISPYPTEKDLEEALGPPRSAESRQPPATFPRFLHEIMEEPPTGFPQKILSLVATSQGTLTVNSHLTTAAGDRGQHGHQLFRCDALDLITALAEWVASPDSILREYPDGTPAPVETPPLVEAAADALRSNVEVQIRAHQGRDVDSLGLGKRLV